MLYDPKWENKTQPVGSIESLIAWLKTKEPGARYDYHNCKGTCLVGLYAAAMGLDWYDDVVPCKPWFDQLNLIACDLDKHWTFGAALARAELV